MARKVQPRRKRSQAKGFPPQSTFVERLSPSKKSQVARDLQRIERTFDAEILASLDRSVASADAGLIGLHMDRGRSAVYKYRNGETPLPGAKAFYLGIHDTDGDLLVRLGNLFYQAAGIVAQARLKCGRMSVVIQQPSLAFEDDGA